MGKFFSKIVFLYAKPFYSFAKTRKNYTQIIEEVKFLSESFSSEKHYLKQISAQIFSVKQQVLLVKNLFKKLNFSQELEKCIVKLAQNRRLGLLEDILNAFLKLDKEEQNIKSVQVILCEEIEQDKIDELKKLLEKQLQQKLELKFELDSSILGGVIVKIDNMMYDASLRNKFNKLIEVVEEKTAIL